MDLLYVQTPILESTYLSKEIGIPVYLKMEALQPSSTYLNRGIGILISDYVSQGKRFFVAASDDDSAVALSYACRMLNVSLKIFIPSNLNPTLKEKIILEGAQVFEEEGSFEHIKEKARQVSEKEDLVLVDPYHHPLIYEGISTLIFELFGAGLKPAAIVLPALKGDLLMGVILGLKSCQWSDIPIITTEIETHCPFAKALYSEKKESDEMIPDLFLELDNQTIYPQIVTDKAALHAGYRFINESHVLIEKESAAALSLIYENLPLLKTFSSLLVIVNGGNNVNLLTYN